MTQQDLRFDDRARKELLLRIEECRSRLWFDVEERKACATTVLRSIKADGEFPDLVLKLFLCSVNHHSV